LSRMIVVPRTTGIGAFRPLGHWSNPLRAWADPSTMRLWAKIQGEWTPQMMEVSRPASRTTRRGSNSKNGDRRTRRSLTQARQQIAGARDAGFMRCG
jgi:hypothetical protein